MAMACTITTRSIRENDFTAPLNPRRPTVGALRNTQPSRSDKSAERRDAHLSHKG